MSVWNKYGTISSEGKIDARFYCLGDDINLDYASKLVELDTRYDVPAQVGYESGQVLAVVEGQWISQLPSGWTRLVKELKDRGPLSATATISDHEGGYRIRIDIDES
jgi:hypothetical protein